MKEQRITLRDIAEQLNISTGTIDRAINGRGRISEETKSQIMKKINELGYKPNRLARALGKNKGIRLVFVTPAHNTFWGEVIKGAKAAQDEIMDFGFHTEFCSQNTDFDSINQVREMEKIIEEKPDGIIIAPLHPYLSATPINNAVEKGIPVITVNIDSKDSKRICYVGEDPFYTGKIVGTLFGRLLGGRGDVAVITGSTELSQFQTRKEGFLETIKSKYPEINIVGYYEHADIEDIAYEISRKLITEVTNLKGIFANTAIGAMGIAKAIRDMGKIYSVSTVGYDTNDEISELLDSNAMSSTVIQSPFLQGYNAVILMHRIILERLVPEREFYYTRTDILVDSSQYSLNTMGFFHNGII